MADEQTLTAEQELAQDLSPDLTPNLNAGNYNLGDTSTDAGEGSDQQQSDSYMGDGSPNTDNTVDTESTENAGNEDGVNESGETETRDLGNLPEDKPTPDHWKEMRSRHKENRDRISELESNNRNLQEQIDKDAYLDESSEQSEDSNGGKASPDDLFQYLSRIDDEDDTTAPEGDRAKVEDMIVSLQPNQIQQVISKARSGAFGENSDFIRTQAQSLLSEALTVDSGRRQLQSEYNKSERERRDSLRILRDRAPHVFEEETDHRKMFEYVLVELNAQLPNLWEGVPRAPEFIQDQIELRNLAQNAESSNNRVIELEQELKDLRDQLGDETSPASPNGRRPGTGKRGISAEEELAQDLSHLREIGGLSL